MTETEETRIGRIHDAVLENWELFAAVFAVTLFASDGSRLLSWASIGPQRAYWIGMVVGIAIMFAAVNLMLWYVGTDAKEVIDDV